MVMVQPLLPVVVTDGITVLGMSLLRFVSRSFS
jgi:hypothetical protein